MSEDSVGLMCNGFQVKSEQDYMSYLLNSHEASLTTPESTILRKPRPKYLNKDGLLSQRVRSEINRSLMRG